MKTLKEIMNDAVLERLEHFGNHRKATSDSLSISIRTLRNYINQMRRDGIEVDSATGQGVEKCIGHEVKAFPTNEFRIYYRDKMLNAVSLN